MFSRKQRAIVEKDRLPYFTRRGTEVSRIESFSDAVFGFALTLLVVSLEVPKSFSELMNTMRGFIAFAICFAILYSIWNRHYTFFRRYGIQDWWIITLNGILLFVILFYVYPLKFVFTLLVAGVLRINSGAPSIMVSQVPTLFVIYGLGFATVYGIFAAMHKRALHYEHELTLTPYETGITRLIMWREISLSCVGLASATLAIILPANLSAFSGFAYFAIGIIEGMFGSREGDVQQSHADAIS